MKLTQKNKKGFTLVELLVVIAIIAVLAGLAAPAIMNALKRAKVVKVSAICVSVETAINNFESEYDYLPYGSGTIPTSDDSVRTDDDVIAVLCGVEDQINFKEIKFFELAAAKGDTAATYSDGLVLDKGAGTAALYDPWGELYYLVIDYDQDGEIDHPFDAGADPINGKKALIHSTGAEKQINAETSTKDIPRSW
ncbi:MAG: type II secretion system protein [Akkermansiaceae bacterium]